MKRLIWNAGFSVFVAGLAFAGDAAAGKAAYDKSCKGCHGPDGTPNASIGKSLGVKMLHLGNPAVQKLSDDELKAVLANGKGKMKATKSVAGKAADDVVAYLRMLKQ